MLTGKNGGLFQNQTSMANCRIEDWLISSLAVGKSTTPPKFNSSPLKNGWLEGPMFPFGFRPILYQSWDSDSRRVAA